MIAAPDGKLLKILLDATTESIASERFDHLASVMDLEKEVSPQLTYRNRVMQLLQVANARGRLNELLDLLLEANPRSKDLRDAVTLLRAPDGSSDASAVRRDYTHDPKLEEIGRQLSTIRLKTDRGDRPSGFLVGPTDIMTHQLAFPHHADFGQQVGSLAFHRLSGNETLYRAIDDYVLTRSGVVVIRSNEPIGRSDDSRSGRSRGWISPSRTRELDGSQVALVRSDSSRGFETAHGLAVYFQDGFFEIDLSPNGGWRGAPGLPCFDASWNFVGMQIGGNSRRPKLISVDAIVDELSEAGFEWNINVGIVPQKVQEQIAPTSRNLDDLISGFTEDAPHRIVEDDVWDDDEDPSDPDSWSWAKAAAVTAYFDPNNLHPLDQGAAPEARVRVLLSSSRTSREGTARWELSDALRIRALQRLAKDGKLRHAREQNTALPDDPLDRALGSLIAGHQPSSAQLQDPTQLRAYLRAASWLEHTGLHVPSPDLLQRSLERAELIAPFRHLTKGFFTGRQRELDELWRYFFDGGICLLIHGPGGIGKSSLLSRFMLSLTTRDATSLDGWRPFVYLDFDRPDLDARDLPGILLAMLRQLGQQIPAARSEIEAVLLDAVRVGAKRRAKFVTKRTDELLGQLAKHLDSPVALVVDTLEEVQYATPDAVSPLIKAIVSLSDHASWLRPIFAGRLPVASSLPLRQIELIALSSQDAAILLSNQLPPLIAANAAFIEKIVDKVGGNPLSLNLAAELLKKEASARDLRLTDDEFWHRLQDTVVQGYLYERIVGHVHDPSVRKLAVPGLVLRHLTAELIVEVLSEPCDLNVTDAVEGQALLEKLAAETALVRSEGTAARLSLRPEIRRAVLENFRRDKSTSEQRRAIHAAAVRYYVGKPGPENRAEEIYHRLLLEEDTQSIDSRWLSGVEQSLRNVVEELDEPRRSYLAVRVGRLEEGDTMTAANLPDWELYAQRRAADLIAMGMASAALGVLEKRRDRSPTSSLYILESEASRVLSTPDLQRADWAAVMALEAADRSGDPDRLAKAYEELARVKRLRGETEDLIRVLDRLSQLGDKLGEDELVLEANVAILESVDAPAADYGDHLVRVFARLPDRAIAATPELARRVAAQSGGDNPEMLKRLARLVGFGSVSPAQGASLREVLERWSVRDPSVLPFVPPPYAEGNAMTGAAQYLLEQRSLDPITAYDIADWLKTVALPPSDRTHR